ncbi:MAG: hypothetical protein ACOC0P_03115 [Planctomycetota bacterium]
MLYLAEAETALRADLRQRLRGLMVETGDPMWPYLLRSGRTP